MASNGAGVCTETPAEEQAPSKATPEVGGNGIGAAKSKPVAVSLGDGACSAAEQAPADTPFTSPVRGRPWTGPVASAAAGTQRLCRTFY